jgi:REP element-mobilizing transposase RayT
MAAHRIYFHLTWSTHRRMPMIDGPTRNFLDEFFRRTIIKEDVTLVALAFLRSHVHLLVRCGSRIDLGHLVQMLKGGSSFAASRQPDNKLGLRWNRQYSVTSVSPKLLQTAIDYIEAQNSRHPDEKITTPSVK